ncbi:MAG: ABC transporter ATP-binding protein [Thermodesulfobacteriota bacterium]
MGGLILKDIKKTFGSLVALQDINLEVHEGEMVCLLGPSGCGKTTLLRLVAGFESPSQGVIEFEGRSLVGVSPQERNFGIVFQSYALFPHLTIKENIAFGMSARRLPQNEIEKRVRALLNLVELTDVEKKFPRQLSGGMQQRVALARALATSPRILLLDEPLSALDAKIRLRLRGEIRRLQKQLQLTTIYVTHDQEEALSIADKIVVMSQGRIQQIGSPLEIYENPLNPFVADFVGSANLCRCQIMDEAKPEIQWNSVTLQLAERPNVKAGKAIFAVRPEFIKIFKQGGAGTSMPPNVVEATINAFTFLGSFIRFQTAVENGEIIILDVPREEVGAEFLTTPRKISIFIPPEAIRIFKDTE